MPYTIERIKHPDRDRTWHLAINGHVCGIVQIVHMTDTLRSIEGTFTAFTRDFKPINVTYDCDKVKHRVSYSINNFISDIVEAIGDKEIHIPRVIEEDAPEQIYVTGDINEGTVDEIATMMRIDVPNNWIHMDSDLKVKFMRNHFTAERNRNIDCPMRDLVQRAKLAKTRSTPLSAHDGWLDK